MIMRKRNHTVTIRMNEKGNAALMNAVNEAIAAAIADGSMDKFVAEANEQASGNTYEGLLDENGNVQ